MRLAFPQYFTARARFLAYVVVAKALIRAGHTLTDDVSDCDAVLYSMCDVMEYPGLVKLRGQTDRPLVVGGSYAYHFRSALLYADAVWVGSATRWPIAGRWTNCSPIRAVIRADACPGPPP